MALSTLVTVAIIACGAALLTQWRRRQAMRIFFAVRYRDPATAMPDSGSVTALAMLVTAIAMGGAALLAQQDRAASKAPPPTLCFLLDCSASMLAASQRSTRLTEAKETILAVIDDMPEAELCLVSFAGKAIVDFPVSHDRRAFRRALAAVNPSLALAAGSNPGRALQTLAGLLCPDAQHGLSNAVLIMLSDGEIHDPQPLLQHIPWAARAYPLVHVLMGTPGQATPVPNPEGPLWLRDPDNNTVATSCADDQALKQLAALSPHPAEFFSPDAPATSIRARIRQLATAGRSRDAHHAAQQLALTALAALLVALSPQRPIRARHTTRKSTVKHDIRPDRPTAVVADALLALLTLAAVATADDIPANVRGNAAARAQAIAAIRADIARDDCVSTKRARLLSNWSALLIIEAQEAIRATAPHSAVLHATASRELSREALRLQPGNAATLQNLATAWRVLQAARAMQTKDDLGDATESEEQATTTAGSQPNDTQNNTANGDTPGTQDAIGSAEGMASADDVQGAGQAGCNNAHAGTDKEVPGANAPTNSATDASNANGISVNAGGPVPPVGTWRDLHLQRHDRPPRPPGVKPW